MCLQTLKSGESSGVDFCLGDIWEKSPCTSHSDFVKHTGRQTVQAVCSRDYKQRLFLTTIPNTGQHRRTL